MSAATHHAPGLAFEYRLVPLFCSPLEFTALATGTGSAAGDPWSDWRLAAGLWGRSAASDCLRSEVVALPAREFPPLTTSDSATPGTDRSGSRGRATAKDRGSIYTSGRAEVETRPILESPPDPSTLAPAEFSRMRGSSGRASPQCEALEFGPQILRLRDPQICGLRLRPFCPFDQS